MKIAVLLATYNGEKYLKEQLDSLFVQTITDFVVYARDDGSSDKTLEILQEYTSAFPDRLVLIPKLGNKNGAKYNFFELCREAKKTDAEYFMFCDQDDVWYKDKIELTLSLMEHSKAETPLLPVLIHTDLEVTDSKLNTINNSFVSERALDIKATAPHKLLIQNNVTGCTVMFDRALLEKAVSVAETDNVVLHDWWFSLVASLFGRIVFLDRPTMKYRQHGDNVLGSKKINSVGYIKQRLGNISYIKQTLREAAQQAQLLYDTYAGETAPDVASMLYDFSHIYDHHKPGRIRVLMKYKIYKQGFIQKTGELMFI